MPNPVHFGVISAVAAIAVLCAGCGAGRPSSVAHIGTTPSTTTAAAGNTGSPTPGQLGASLDKYAACMRTHGVPDFPDPVVSGSQVQVVVPKAVGTAPRFKRAQAACQSLAPTGFTQPKITTQDQADYLKAAACMRSHNIVGFPDPTFVGGQVNFPLPPGMKDDSQFEAARQICQKLIPAGLPYSAGN